ncbi:MAG TPA: Gfo/Idh/MocA family oxidoreductase [candidate division Zixibacteria bacterium]|nr:Gfo/Idh/MocA family oxidoreductase [candidate division Zixibacteria bacterium]
MMTFDPLGVGLVGAGGRWGPRAHAPALKGIAETRLVAVCTAHEETARAAAEKLGAARAYGSLDALIRDAEVEAVVVAVRVPAHYALARKAIEAGKHVFCEWPLGANTREAEDLAALAREKNVRTMVGLQRRASPAYLYMRELVEQGYVGQVLAVAMTLMNSGVLTRTSDRTWQRDAALGANTLTITFAHVFDAMCMVVGEPAEVSAVVSTQVPQWFETDTQRYVDVTSPDNVLVHGRLQSGAVFSACCGVQPYHGSGHRLEIYGRDGTLAMIGGGEAGEELRRKIFGARKGDKALEELPVPERFKWVPEALRDGYAYDVAQMWVRFAAAIRAGSDCDPDFEHAVRRHRTLDAIARASRTGERQEVAP